MKNASKIFAVVFDLHRGGTSEERSATVKSNSTADVPVHAS